MNAPPENLSDREFLPEDGPGRRLSSAREKAGLSLEEVSGRLHLDRRTVEMLEGDDFSDLPAPTFIRGYLRSYARLLNIAPDPLVEAFDRRGLGPPALVADIARQAEVRSSDPWVIMLTSLLVASLTVLAALWYQTNKNDDRTKVIDTAPESGPIDRDAEDPHRSRSETERREPKPAIAPEGTLQTGVLVGNPKEALRHPKPKISATPETSALPTAITAPGEAAPTPPAVTTGREERRPLHAAPANADNSLKNTDTNKDEPSLENSNFQSHAGLVHGDTSAPFDTVVMRFERDAWVEMYDGHGSRLFYSLARAGREIEVNGIRPIRVLLGYVKGVQVEYNGAPFDFSAHVAKGIARFEMRP